MIRTVWSARSGSLPASSARRGPRAAPCAGCHPVSDY
jgi:hypothetical protein